MSGGHFDYVQYQVSSGLEQFAVDTDVRKRFPDLGRALMSLGASLSLILHDIDWDFSGDSEIKDDAKFEKVSLQVLLRGIPVVKEEDDVP